MIGYILSIIGCISGIIISILCYFFGKDKMNNYWILITIFFLISILLIYWNLKIELKKN